MSVKDHRLVGGARRKEDAFSMVACRQKAVNGEALSCDEVRNENVEEPG
jgi:hypothetical protein